MGMYINKLPTGESLPATGKAKKLLSIEGAEEIKEPVEWSEDIVCVANNGFFEAAAYAFNENEMIYFARPDGRPKTWLKVPGALALTKLP